MRVLLSNRVMYLSDDAEQELKNRGIEIQDISRGKRVMASYSRTKPRVPTILNIEQNLFQVVNLVVALVVGECGNQEI